jgi:hypothetical protein
MTANDSPAVGSPVFDPSLYPRTYRMSRRQFVLLLSLGAILLAVGLFLAWQIGSSQDAVKRQVLRIVLVLFFTGLGLYQIGDVLRYRVTLRADSIELTNLFGKRRLARADIGSRRIEDRDRSISKLVLIPNRKSLRRLKIPLVLTPDSAFEGWIADIPDSEVEELVKHAQEMLEDGALGASPGQRLDNIKKRQKTALVATLITLALGVYGLFDPHPYPLVLFMLALFPWAAMLLTAHWRRAYGITGDNEFHPHLMVPLLLPGCVLGLRAVFDVHDLNDWSLLLPTLAIAATMSLCAGLALGARGRTRWLYLLVLMPLMAFYGYGSVALANAKLDPATSQVFQTTVQNRSVQVTARHTDWNLQLAPWGPRSEAVNTPVSHALFEDTKVGDQVCVALHPGALGIPWFEVATCG